jgi:putative ABC transport system permease protein
MIKNYFKIAFRNILRSKAQAAINIIGLSVGMAVAMLIGLWVWDELFFDRYYNNYDRIAMVKQNVTNNGEVQTWESVPYPLANELRKNYGSDFKRVVMATGMGDHTLTYGDKKLIKNGIYFEPGVTDMLTLHILKGTRQGLKDPASVMLSASTAKAYFGNADPINKVMKLSDNYNVRVTGVYEDLPHNNTFGDLNFIAPWDLYFNNVEWIKTAPDPWRPNQFLLFVQLADHADAKQVSVKIKDAKLRNLNPQLARTKPALFLEPMSQWHLRSQYINGVNVGGKIKYVWMFGLVGLFVLLLACINFVNLSTARSEKRAKEVGIRKAIGSLRLQLVYQFLTESVLTTTFSFVVCVIVVQLILPYFNSIAEKKIELHWNNVAFWCLLFGFSIFTGLVAGSYPALYLSSFKPVDVLKGTFKAGKRAAVPRKVLLVVQFTVSVVLIIGTLVVFRQIEFAKNRPIGYNYNNLVAVNINTNQVHGHLDAVKQELTNAGIVTSVAEAGASPTRIYSTSSGIEWQGKDPAMNIDFPNMSVSYDFGKTIGWNFKEGRDFSKAYSTDSTGIIINETAANFMQMKNPVGSFITWDGTPLKVIGVVHDILSQSPYDPVKPSIFYLSNDPGSVVLLKLNPMVSASAALQKIESILKQYNPDQPFSYQFVDEQYAQKFSDEVRIAKLAGFFAALAIFISCLGVFGLASFLAEQRIKEIGIRKVLGASTLNCWQLLSKDFMVLVTISLLIAAPLGWMVMNKWLQNYQYRTNLSWTVFAIAGIGVLLITLATVSFQAIKAAIENPVKSLRAD